MHRSLLFAEITENKVCFGNFVPFLVGGRGKYLYLCPQKPGGIVLKKLHPREEFLQHEVQLPRILFKTLHAPNELKTFLKF